MSKTPKDHQGDNGQRLARGRAAFRDWRRTRPFWAGLFTLAAALLLLYPPYASLKFGDIEVSLRTPAGVTALVIGTVLIACGFLLWWRPELRVPVGVVTLVLSVVAVVAVNLGSFLIGTTTGLIGAALAIAWSPNRRRGRTGPARRNREPGEAARVRSGGSTPSPVPRERGEAGRGESTSSADAVRGDGGRV